MPELSDSRSNPAGPLPPGPRRQKVVLTSQNAYRKPITTKLVTGFILALLVMGLAGLNFVSSAATLPPAARLPLQGDSSQQALLIPEPGVTGVPLHPTRVLGVAPTAAPLPLPTATSVPPAAPVPDVDLPPVPAAPTAVVEAGIQHVVIISVDGLRPEAIDLADTPNLDRLIAKGAYQPKAQALVTSRTLPGHASMLTGVVEQKHGLLWGEPYIGWPGIKGPTLLSLAHDAGLSTGMISGKEKLNYLVLPNSVDKLWVVDAGDIEVKDKAVEFIQVGLPNVLFIHFPDNDRVGHAYGWLSQNQLYAVTFVDSMIGEIVAALDQAGYMNSTLLIINADHGGHNKNHGDDSPEDRTIPWLAVGPGVPQGVTLYSHINIYDTTATAAYALKLSIPEDWDGRPVMDIFPQ